MSTNNEGGEEKAKYTGVFTLGDAVDLFKQCGNGSVKHEDAADFIKVLNRRRIKFNIVKSDNPELTKFVKA